jgi:hypothetical protein
MSGSAIITCLFTSSLRLTQLSRGNVVFPSEVLNAGSFDHASAAHPFTNCHSSCLELSNYTCSSISDTLVPWDFHSIKCIVPYRQVLGK